MQNSRHFLYNATLPAQTLHYALNHQPNGQITDMLKYYPALVTIDHAVMARSAEIYPFESPNHSRQIVALSEANFPMDMGTALLEAAHLGIADALNDIQFQQPAQWFNLTPVHWQAERDHVNLVEISQDDISIEEMKALVESIAPWLAEWGWHIHVTATNRWFIRTETPFNYFAPDLVLAQSGQLEHCLPHGNDLKKWQTLITEIQMLWHDHPVNQARAENNQLSINSVWLDGGVQTQEVTPEGYVLWKETWSQIQSPPNNQNTDMHQHLAWVNDQLTPAALEFEKTGHSTIELLGATWKQTINLSKPTFTERLKGHIKTKDRPNLMWLEEPQFDLPQPDPA